MKALIIIPLLALSLSGCGALLDEFAPRTDTIEIEEKQFKETLEVVKKLHDTVVPQIMMMCQTGKIDEAKCMELAAFYQSEIKPLYPDMLLLLDNPKREIDWVLVSKVLVKLLGLAL